MQASFPWERRLPAGIDTESIVSNAARTAALPESSSNYLELLVDGDLVPVRQSICLIGQTDYRLKFCEHLVGHSFGRAAAV